ncbi:Cyclic nucleotide-binding protein [Pseudocohnilembus persalinus]|uniref:Cyclic nucleotide-binding protein n=1 Tax=Pseudocohnilembus persalinus TaxID=266149 RepID=A0A0V0R287_PSEPJ|nr:Cyclic nucleotide-binding protein [Pseudocohnilembus persalinus]|eukprot:KRX08384.1 Cyclic nucleotide-binding protein [Pseudocohnilembus persalinus]
MSQEIYENEVQQVINVQQGEIFGELACISDKGKRSGTCISISRETVVAYITKKEYINLRNQCGEDKLQKQKCGEQELMQDEDLINNMNFSPDKQRGYKQFVQKSVLISEPKNVVPNIKPYIKKQQDYQNQVSNPSPIPSQYRIQHEKFNEYLNQKNTQIQLLKNRSISLKQSCTAELSGFLFDNQNINNNSEICSYREDIKVDSQNVINYQSYTQRRFNKSPQYIQKNGLKNKFTTAQSYNENLLDKMIKRNLLTPQNTKKPNNSSINFYNDEKITQKN